MEKQEKEDFKGIVVNIIFIVSFFVVLASTFARYYFLEEYSFTIEASCDPSYEWCFDRDCTNPDDCPPNGLSDYRQFDIPASTFDTCESDGCAQYCTREHKCEETLCDSATDTCKGIR